MSLNKTYQELSDILANSKDSKVPSLGNPNEWTIDESNSLEDVNKTKQELSEIQKKLIELEDIVKNNQNKQIHRENSFNKIISEQIIKAYQSPRNLFTYYLKLMKNFQDWEVNGDEKQKLASFQNKKALESAIQFLNSFNNFTSKIPSK